MIWSRLAAMHSNLAKIIFNLGNKENVVSEAFISTEHPVQVHFLLQICLLFSRCPRYPLPDLWLAI